jgi:hypothetical protein
MVAGLVGLGGYVRDARAGATVDLLFVGRNGAPIAATNTVTAVAGDTLTMAVRMSNDQTLTAAVFSLNYDLDNKNELDVMSAFGWAGVAISKKGTDFFQPLSGFAPITPTFVGSFQGITTNFSLPGVLPAPGSYQMGTVTWHVNGGTGADGADILSGLFFSGIDGFGDGGFNNIDNTILFRSASVNFIPEPGTASLLGLGLVGLVLMGRRSR